LKAISSCYDIEHIEEQPVPPTTDETHREQNGR
jgi:hypothetical protein